MSDALLWDLAEAARQLGGVSPRTVRRLIASGALPAVRIGRLRSQIRRSRAAPSRSSTVNSRFATMPIPYSFPPPPFYYRQY